MFYLCKLFILFIIFSFLGWCLEVTYTCFDQKKFVNRGFLMGPLCPVYGVGSILIILLLSKYREDPLVVFGLAVLICSIVEYFTSYILEKIFKTRWWDYTQMRFNINGRICLEMIIPFGILGVLIVELFAPLFTILLSKLSGTLIYIASIILFIIFIADVSISYSVILKFKNTALNAIKSYRDSTEEVSKFVRDTLLNSSTAFRRLIESFPNYNIIDLTKLTERIKNIAKKVQK